jgi:acetyl-CoA carboxylase biotin carboxyl carrier protein
LPEDIPQEDFDEIRALLSLVAEHGLSELTATDKTGLSITIKTESDAPEQVYHASPRRIAPPAAPPEQIAAPRLGLPLESPMVGVFFRAPSPEDGPFISVGDIVRVGQTIGLIEAMKVFSEIPAEAGGRVVAIVAENGQLVQQGQPLAFVEPL